MCSAPSLGGLSTDSDREPEETDELESRTLPESEPDTGTISSDSSPEEEDTGTVAQIEFSLSISEKEKVNHE